LSIRKRFGPLLCLSAALAGCGGGGGGGESPPPVTVTPPTSGTPTPTPTPTATCSITARQEWVAARLREFYLYPELLTTVEPSANISLQDFINRMTARAVAEGRDKTGFSYVISIREEDALRNSGAAAGFGIRLSFRERPNSAFVAEAFEGAPALAAGIDRGTEILAIGTSTSNLRLVSEIIAAEGTQGFSNALGPSDPGVARTLRIRNAAGVESTVTVTKASFSLDPVSDRYGARVLQDGTRRVGYVNLRTFSIDAARSELRQVFANFRSQGITEVVVDLRYNGGGLVSIGELLSNLLGGQRTSSDVMSRTVFNERNAFKNRTTFFAPQAESVPATKIAFIGTDGTASASELVMNAFIPYLGPDAALVGSNTFGKPVGQEGFDRAECDDRARIMSFKTENRDRNGDFFGGLASSFRSTCRAADDLSRPMGDPAEASTRTALDFLAGRSCTPISIGATTQTLTNDQPRLLRPAQPNAVQREVPGFF
jgi:C-terminal processing protease CtpA/Prc